MKISYQLIGLLFLLQIIACKNAVKEPATDQIYNPDTLNIIDADNTKELIDLKLSDLADSLELIPLETTEQCLLGNFTEYYVSEKYILAYSQDGVYKFSKNGKFIKKLVSLGRGPGEIHMGAGSSKFVVDGKKDLLYIYDQFKRHKFMVYDINSERFIGPVKKYFPGYGNFAIYKDSLIICSLFSYNDSIDYAVYIQNNKGEFVSGITHDKKMLNEKKNAYFYQPSILHIADSCYRVSFLRDDTLFTIKENQLIPYLALNFNLPRESPPNAETEKGSRFILFPEIEAPDFMIIRINVTQEVIWYSSEAGDSKSVRLYLFFDKMTGKGARIRTYTDDLIGETQNVLKQSQVTGEPPIKFPDILPNGKFVVAYYPSQITAAVEKGLNYTHFSNDINKQLLDVNRSINEMDNPILLVGVPKKKI